MPTKSIDEFISNYPPEVQTILQKIRALIQKSAPGAPEGLFSDDVIYGLASAANVQAAEDGVAAFLQTR